MSYWNSKGQLPDFLPEVEARFIKQILNDMYVDPELLAELDEEQKQILFCKMREEQIRKWRFREEQEKENEMVGLRKEGGKKVSFLMGGDGEPLVLVLGENEDVDALLQERARRQAEMEGEAIRKAAEEELDKLVRLSQSTVEAMEQSSLSRSQQKSQKNFACDPTRDAVVQSLQEATREMEKEILALELQERISEKPEEPISQKSPIVNNSLSKGKLQKNLVKNELSVHSSQLRSDGGSEKENSQPNIKVVTSKPNISVQPYFNENVSPCIFGVAAQIEQYERLTESSIEALKNATLERAKKRRQKEIFDNLRNQVEAAKKQVEANATAVTVEKEEVVWREQERKAKEAERRIREIARRARVEHLRTASISFTDCQLLPEKDEDINGNFKTDSDMSNNNHNTSYDETPIQLEDFVSTERTTIVRPKLRPIRPSSKHAIIEWFQEEELPKGVGLNPQKTQILPWFHGIISRLEAEKLLEKAEVGSFLIRVSERIWGYAASYRAPDRCRHYLIDAVNGKYAFLGSNQATHQTLDKLIEFHTKEYITMSGCELLNRPCGQEDPRIPDYIELLIGTKYFPLVYSKT